MTNPELTLDRSAPNSRIGDARCFDIRDFGAVPDRKTLNTEAIAAAISACNENGGGRVLVPAGEWPTGAIHLRSDVELHVAEDATLHFSDTFAHYLVPPPPATRVEHYEWAPGVVPVHRGGVEARSFSPLIYARNCTNIAVTGKGTLNGHGQRWWDTVKPHEQNGVLQHLFELSAAGVPITERVFATPDCGLRPAFIQPIDCSGVRLEDFTLRDGPAWNINPVRCNDLTIRGIQLLSPDGPNNDGIDPEMCRNVLIEDCFIDTADDCIALKSGRDAEGWRHGRPCENVTIRRVRTARGLAGVAIGSEISGGVRNVLVEDCLFEGTRGGIRIKSMPGRGGFIEDVVVRNVTMKDIRWDAIMVTVAYGRGGGSTGAAHTAIRRLEFSDIKCSGAAAAISIIGSAENPIRDLVFKDLRITSATGARFTHVADLTIDDVTIEPTAAPAFAFTHTDGTVFKFPHHGGSDTHFQIHGNIGRGFRVLHGE